MSVQNNAFLRAVIRFLFVFRESVKLLKIFENDDDSKIYCILLYYQNESSPSAAKISHNGREIILNRTKIDLF